MARKSSSATSVLTSVRRAEDFVLIDIETGDYEVDAADITALHRLLARRPEAQVWMRRVGSRSAYRLGPRRVTTAR